MHYKRSADGTNGNRNHSPTIRTLILYIIAIRHAERDAAEKRNAKEEDEAPEDLGLACHTSRDCCDWSMAVRTGRVPGIVHDVVDGCRVSCTCVYWSCTCVYWIGFHAIRIGLDKRSGRRQVNWLRLVRLLRSIEWVVLQIVIIEVVGLWS